MANYRADLEDVEFNLFDMLQIHENKYGLDRNSLRDILHQFEKFVRLEIFPTRATSDRDGLKYNNGEVISPEYIKNLHAKYYENGWFALGQPEEFGGMEVPESLSIACLSLATGANTAYMMYPGLSKGAMNVIRLKGNDWMKKNLIPPMMEGKWGGTMCLTEAGAGSDVGALRTTATPSSDGTFSIKGTKIFISSGEVDFNQNTIHLVLARTPKGGEGTKGISLFVVPKIWVDENGKLTKNNDVFCSKIEEKMGIHASATCELQFGAKGECRGYLIGEEFQGMSTMFIMMNEARLLCGLQGESQGNLAFELANNYAKERSQFGQEINKHPDVRKMLLKMRAAARGMRALLLYTGKQFESEKAGQNVQDIIGLLTPVCKAYFTEQGLQLATDAVQVHGGYGFCSEYEVEQFIRDSVIGRIYEGTNGIQAVDFIMRKVLKDQGKAFSKILGSLSTDLGNLTTKMPEEIKLVFEVADKIQFLVKYFLEKFSQKDQNYVLTHAQDFLMLSSYLIISWQLGLHATKAMSELSVDSTGSERKKYLETKLVDFQIYVQHYLTHAMGMAKTIEIGKCDLLSCSL